MQIAPRVMGKRRFRPFSKNGRGITLPLLALAFAALGLLATRWAPGHEAFIERVYSRGIYPIFASPISTITGLLPFSLIEILLLSSPLWLGAVIWRVIAANRRRGTVWPSAIARALMAVLGIAAFLFGAFELGWAVNYSRQPYAVVSGLPAAPRASSELAELCRALTLRANELREALPEDEDGVFSVSNAEQRKRIPDAYKRAAAAPWLGGSYGKPKPVLLSRAMSWAGISGIFVPITFEANVNNDEPSLLAGSAAAHESAHLRGFAREDEANFIAYAVCRASGDAALEYSGTALAMIHAVNALEAADGDAALEILALRSEAVNRDFADYRSYWKAFEGPVMEAQSQVNNAYLKANHQDDGVRSYGRMVDLLLADFMIHQ